ncbi:lytic polysaccharide monooxygenase, partial [Viridothelium virens]
MATFSIAAALLGLASSVSAHGQVQGIVANGEFYEGYSPSFQYSNPPPTVIGWSIPQDLDNGFVASSALQTDDIICHVNATPAKGHAVVAAGDVVELQWSAWPSSHHGPVIDYLANCNGACETVDKTKLEFFKIDGVGLVNDNPVPGTWASDQLIANNNSWVVTIPKSIAPGNYVLRHEIIALHSAGSAGGAQMYPHCINLQITGSGTTKPTGTLGTALYKEADPGIEVNIYQSLSYVIPGPSPIADAVSMKQS